MSSHRRFVRRFHPSASSRLAATAVVLAGVTMAAAGPAGAADPAADLVVRASAPATPATGSSFTLTVVVADLGPSPATDIVIGVDVGPGLVVTAAPGGAIADGGHSAGYSVARLRTGARVVLPLTVQVPAGATGRKPIVAAARSLTVPDPDTTDNSRRITLRPVTPA